MHKTVCIYASSSEKIEIHYQQAVTDLANALALHQYDIIYGGCKIGLMGIVARTVVGRVKLTGIIPQFIYNRGIVFEHLNETVITQDMFERKKEMEKRADGFIALPGGFGTLDEVSECIANRLLNLHKKPIILFNIFGAFDGLIAQYEYIFQHNFAKRNTQKAYYVAQTVEEVIVYLNSYKSEEIESKWFS
jgi:uncharacterized protein (TIGR00730 family)